MPDGNQKDAFYEAVSKLIDKFAYKRGMERIDIAEVLEVLAEEQTIDA